MKSKSLAVYLVETGRTDRTERVDILTPKDENGDELVISVDSTSVTISKLSGTQMVQKTKILLTTV